MDSISEKAIMDTIFSIIKNKTTIMVAHRLSTIKNCDLIFVFNKGHLVEQGTHNQLLRKNGFYKKIMECTKSEFLTIDNIKKVFNSLVRYNL